MSQRQGCVFCNQFSCIVWGLSFLVKIQDEKYGAIYYTTQTQRIKFDSCYKFPYCFICEKSEIDNIYTVITILVARVDQNKFELF